MLATTKTPATTTANTLTTSMQATAAPTTPKQITTATQTQDSTTAVPDTTTPASQSPLPTTSTTPSTTPQTTAATDELLKMLIIGVSVGVSGLLLIILISVGICLACRAMKRNKSPHGSSAPPSVEVPDMYNGKVPSRSSAPTPVMFNNPYLSELNPSPSPLSRNGRAHTPAIYQSHHLSPPQSQKWLPFYGGYTNHGLQADNETNSNIQRQPCTDLDMRHSQHC
ncbi:putative uncharacterized protein DDB_G0290521 [Pecten maximus]|uniref:putative uncharacterized protein DDB_G0290521 n=1 Tax=Pecten maximus TaxID=6579 RepID=UPI001458CC01|nr:putative uncharacterized protein DDB_G0290521 [Pecten maximus]